MLCNDLEGWGGGIGGRFKREGIYIYIQLILFVVQQKLTQHCYYASIKQNNIINWIPQLQMQVIVVPSPLLLLFGR